MEITSNHVEWAVVWRLSKLLEEPNPQFNVTDTYASFIGILCWVMQRIRAPGSPQQDLAAKRIRDNLGKQTVEDWGVHTRNDIAPLSRATVCGVGPFPEFQGRPVNKFLVDLRNAVAHGDARTIEPFHLRRDGRAAVELGGFVFHCVEKDRNRNVVFEGQITLLEADMRRIGTRLGYEYCRGMGSDEFGEDSLKGVIEKRAAMMGHRLR